MVGACHECRMLSPTISICKPLDTPDPSCTVGLIGFPCGTGMACETGSTCTLVNDSPAWTTGFCSPDCEEP